MRNSLGGVVQRRCGGYSACMTDKPLGDERMLRLGEERLDDYMKRLVDFMDSLDKEPRKMFIPFVADMAAAHAIILRHVRMWGATEGIEEARKLFEEHVEDAKADLRRPGT